MPLQHCCGLLLGLAMAVASTSGGHACAEGHDHMMTDGNPLTRHGNPPSDERAFAC